MRLELVEPEDPLLHERFVVQLTLDDVRQHGVGQRHVGVRANREVLVCERGSRSAAGVDHDELRTGLLARTKEILEGDRVRLCLVRPQEQEEP